MCSVMSSECVGVVWATKSPPIKAGDNRATKSPPIKAGDNRATKSPPIKAGDNRATKSPPIKAGFFYALSSMRLRIVSCLSTQAMILSDNASAFSFSFLSRYAPTASVIAPEARLSNPPWRAAHCCRAFENRL